MKQADFKYEYHKKSDAQWQYIKLMCVMSASIAGPLKAKIARESDEQIISYSIEMAHKLMGEIFAQIDNIRV